MSRFVRRGKDFLNIRHITRIEISGKKVNVHMTERNSHSGGWVWFSGGDSRDFSWKFDNNEEAATWAHNLATEINELKS